MARDRGGDEVTAPAMTTRDRALALIRRPARNAPAVAISLTVHIAVIGVAVLAAREVVIPPRVQEVVLVEPASETPVQAAPGSVKAKASRPAARPVVTPTSQVPEPPARSRPAPEAVPVPMPPEPARVPVQLPAVDPVAAEPSRLAPVDASSTVDLVTGIAASPPSTADGRSGISSQTSAGAGEWQPAEREVGGARQGGSASLAAARTDEGPTALAFPRYNDNAKPTYPRQARLRGEQGTVLLSVHVTEDGRVGDVRIAQSSGFPELDETGLAAVRRWTFHPARRGDRTIAAWIRVPIRFRLEDGR